MSPDDVILPTPATHSLPTEIAEMIFSPTLSYMPVSTRRHSASLSSITPNSSIFLVSGGESRPGAENGECKLLGPFALFIQGALGLLALLVLVLKRWRERPQRPLKVWAFDASKQVVGSALLHVANLLMSMLSSGQLTIKAGDFQANPCSFYLLNLAIDVSFVPGFYKMMDTRVETNAFAKDYYWHTHPGCTPTTADPRFHSHTAGSSARVNTVWELRPAAENNLVAQTVVHLLSRPARNESLCLFHLPNMPMDYTSW